MSTEYIINITNGEIQRDKNIILENVNFQVTKGEFVYLIGKVGSGKTSLIKSLYAEIPLSKGDAQIAGFDLQKIKNKDIPKLRRKLGIVFQDFQLLTDRNVYNNLAFVLKATGMKKKTDIEKKVVEVLTKVGLEDKKDKMPHRLSGGEQQRVVIARALLNDPEIILADEPTGNLDPESSETIMNILFDIKNNGRAVVMATHNYNILKKHKARTIKCEDAKATDISEPIETFDFSDFE